MGRRSPNLATNTTAPSLDDLSHTIATRRLRSDALYLAWAGWVALACATVGAFIAAIPARYAEILQSCASHRCTGLAAYLVALDAFIALVWLSLATIIFWRRPGDRIGLFSSITLVTFGVARFPDTLLALGIAHPAWWLPVEALRFFGSACMSVFAFVFPDGHFTPRVTRWIALAWIAVQIPEFFFPKTLASSNGWPPLLRFAGFLGFTLCVVSAQAWRYQRALTTTQRRQTRWAVLGLALALCCYLALSFGYPLALTLDPTLGSVPPPALTTAISLTFLFVPLTLAISIVRSRLYDVDVLIHRALVYGSLTVSLSLLYLVAVLVLQTIASAVTGQTRPSSLVIVLSTLLIAALVYPLRRALQRTVDRRFYRSTYDRSATVEAFTARLRHVVDLNEIRERLLDVAEETMRPTHSSLWLRPPKHVEPRE
ncbi:MAG TPA: hypothetical protein VF812_02890 [Ktedonobacterales bacterium]